MVLTVTDSFVRSSVFSSFIYTFIFDYLNFSKEKGPLQLCVDAKFGNIFTKCLRLLCLESHKWGVGEQTNNILYFTELNCSVSHSACQSIPVEGYLEPFSIIGERTNHQIISFSTFEVFK
jgi:hypothetical protein